MDDFVLGCRATAHTCFPLVAAFEALTQTSNAAIPAALGRNRWCKSPVSQGATRVGPYCIHDQTINGGLRATVPHVVILVAAKRLVCGTIVAVSPHQIVHAKLASWTTPSWKDSLGSYK